MRKLNWLAAGLAAITLTSGALAQDDPKALFGARYAELRTAMQARDTAAIAKVITPDYTMTDIRGGSHDAAGLLALVGRMQAAGGTGERKIEGEVVSATITGSTATVKEKSDTKATRTGPDGKPQTMELILVSDDTWALVDGVWRLKTSVQKDLTVMRDGEEFFHQAN